MRTHTYVHNVTVLCSNPLCAGGRAPARTSGVPSLAPQPYLGMGGCRGGIHPPLNVTYSRD
jgi:hypothetical protein